RDLIEVHLDLGGYPVNLIDTAGMRATVEDPVEREGIRRAHESASRADLVLWVIDAADRNAMPDLLGEGPGARTWIIANKIDLLAAADRAQLPRTSGGARVMHCISAATGAGLDHLLAAL